MSFLALMVMGEHARVSEVGDVERVILFVTHFAIHEHIYVT